MADTFRDRIAQAIGDPGSIAGNRLGPSWGAGNEGYAEEQESVTRWATRAVLQVVSEHVPINVVEPTGHPIGVALLIAFNSLATLVAGLWIGSVWL